LRSNIFSFTVWNSCCPSATSCAGRWPLDAMLAAECQTYVQILRCLPVPTVWLCVVPQSLWHYDPLTLQYMTSQQNIQSPPS
jgi:hypothetical protein